MDPGLKQQVRHIVLQHGRLGAPEIRDSDDLYALGLTSHASVAVMLALEAGFEVEFPDSLLKRHVFESVDAISRAIQELLQGRTARAGAA